MGTRADFYVGRGESAEWLGSIAWDGYPEGVSRDALDATSERVYRKHVVEFFAKREDVTLPEQGWPWPWETSHTTDFAYAFDAGRVWGSCFGGSWRQPLSDDEEHWDDEGHENEARPVFPDMTERKNVQFGGKRSGIMVISAPSVAPPSFDARKDQT